MECPGLAAEPRLALTPTQNWGKRSGQHTQLWYTLPAAYKEAMIIVIFFSLRQAVRGAVTCLSPQRGYPDVLQNTE